MNGAWATFAYHRRLDSSLAGVPAPNRASLRAEVRRGSRGLRKAVFGVWKSRGR